MDISITCDEAYRWLKSMPSGHADALVTDPPYCSGGTNATKQSPAQKYVQSGQKLQWPDFQGDQRDALGYLGWATLWLTEAHRVLKPNAHALIFTSWQMLPLTSIALQSGGFIWRGIIPWDKTEACRPNGRGAFSHQAEYVLWGTKGKVDRSKGACMPGLFRHRIEPPGVKMHMTGKPVALMRDLLKCVSEGGLVLDPFMGSGSTGAAANELGLRFAGCELSPEIYEVARKRLDVA